MHVFPRYLITGMVVGRRFNHFSSGFVGYADQVASKARLPAGNILFMLLPTKITKEIDFEVVHPATSSQNHSRSFSAVMP